MELEKLIYDINEYLNRNYDKFYISLKPYSFIGVKYNKDDKYYILFISNYMNNTTLSYRMNVNNPEINKKNIESFSKEEILKNIDYILKISKENTPAKILKSQKNEQHKLKKVKHKKIESIEFTNMLEFEKSINIDEIEEKYKNIHIENLPFNLRLYNICKNNNILTLEDFLGTSLSKFNELPLCGKKSIKEVYEKKIFILNNLERIYMNIEKIKEESITYELNEELYKYDNLKLKNEVDENEYYKYIELGIDLASTTLEIMEQYLTDRQINIFKMRMNIVDDDTNTLEYIGNNIGLTRERIRQILKKINKKTMLPIYRDKIKNGIVKIFNKIKTEDFLGFLLVGVYDLYNEEFLKFILDVVDEKFCINIQTILNEQYFKLIGKNEVYNKIENIEDKILSIINFPNIINKNSEEIYNNLNTLRKPLKFNNYGTLYVEKNNNYVDYESYLEKRLIEIISKMSFVKNIKTQSLKIDYVYNDKHHSYYPDIQLLTNDNRIIVLEIKPLFHMVESSNLKKYDELKKYCELNGFGYAMIDDRYNSIDKLYNIEIPIKTQENFINYLKEKRKINYGQYKVYKNENNITLEQTLKIILVNNEITFQLKPFKIMYKKR